MKTEQKSAFRKSRHSKILKFEKIRVIDTGRQFLDIEKNMFKVEITLKDGTVLETHGNFTKEYAKELKNELALRWVLGR